MPEACRATISLSDESRPRPISTPTSTAMGIVKISTGGSVQRKSSAMVPASSEWRTIKIHQANELRNEKNKGEDSESQKLRARLLRGLCIDREGAYEREESS